MRRALYPLLLCLSLAGLSGCGGGGGTASPDPTTPTTPTPTPTPTPPDTPTVSGQLWHSDSKVGNYESGTYVSPLNGSNSAFVTDYKFSIVDSAGARLARTSYDAGAEATSFKITQADGRTQIAGFSIDGDFAGVRMAPNGANVILASWGASYIDLHRSIVYDFANDKLLFAAARADANDAFDWLPDGRLVRVRANGNISTMTTDGRETATGAVQWPQGWHLGKVFASPDGQGLVARLDSDAGSDHDLWVMKLDGKEFGRLTTTNISTYAVWSPDAKQIAFNKDTGSSCSDASCQGTCDIWYAPATARSISAVEASKDAFKFTVKSREGSSLPLGCQLLAWTR